MQWVKDCSQKPEISGQHVAGWPGARKGDGHGSWPSCATAAARGQADAAEVTVMCAPGWRQRLASDSSQDQLFWGTCVSWLLLYVGFPLLWWGDSVPVSRLGIVLAASCRGRGRWHGQEHGQGTRVRAGLTD